MVIKSNFPWDLAVENRNGQLTLIVEVKSKTNVSPEWATKFRRNLIAHYTFLNIPYFLMVFPDKMYLWTNNHESSINHSEPNYTIDAKLILKPYYERAKVKPEEISGKSLELIVASWLGEIIYSEKPPEYFDQSQRWLLNSGLYSAITGGRLRHEVVA